MAAPVWVVGVTHDQSGGGGVSFTKPSSLANGDVVYILFYAWGNLLNSTTTKPGAPSGFTEIYWQVGAGTFLPSQAVYRKIITNAAGEPASYTVADPPGGYGSQDAQGGVIGRVTGADTTTPEDDSGVTQGTANPADTGNVISTSQNDALLLLMCVNDITSAPGTPTGMTVIFAGDGGDSASYQQTLSAQVTNANRTSSMGATGHWTMGFVAIKPPAGGGGGQLPPGLNGGLDMRPSAQADADGALLRY